MKIAIIVRKLNTKGGTQRQAVCLARELKNKGHEIKLYTFLYSPSDCYEDELRDLEVIALGSYPAHSRFLFWQENKAAKMLARMIDDDTDLLNPHDQISYRAAYYVKKNMPLIPSVWMMNDLPTRMFSLMRESEVSPDFRPTVIKKIIARLFDWWEITFFIRAQDRITTLDDRDRNWAKILFGKEACTVRSGIDIASFPYAYAQHIPRGDGNVRLLTTGIFFPHRRFEDAIEAVKVLRDASIDVSLTIVGDFSPKSGYVKKIFGIIENRGLSNCVRLVGRISEKNLRTAYEESDIYISPNHLQSWGLAVFEAMASGSPVIVSTTAGASEVLTDGENALLVPPKNPEAIAKAIERLITDPGLYESLSKKGRTFVEENISWERYANGMMKVFEEVISRTNPS